MKAFIERWRFFLEGVFIGLVCIILGTSMVAVLVAYVLPAKRTTSYEEGFKAGVAAQKINEKTLEEAAMKWWAGSPDINGARERLCWNYYPPSKKEK